jgi:signal transduction histidine kinase
MTYMQMGMLRSHIPTDEGRQALQELLDVLKKSTKNLRLLSHSLHTSFITNKGLEGALRTELNRVEAFTDLHCELNLKGEPHPLTSEVDLLMFRIAQESIQNVLKHAKATQLAVHLEYDTERVCMRVVDNGKGISEDSAASTGLGLTNMRQRAGMMGGSLDIRKAGPSGTEVCLVAPYKP